MTGSERIKLIVALLILGAAVFFSIRFFRTTGGGSEKAFFYDLSERKLFTAPRTSVPPIQGVNDTELDAVRAVVISTNGHPEDKASWKIAYLEKYSPELKRQMEVAQQGGEALGMGRGEALGHRFVRRVDDPEWFPMSSPEAERIVTEWASPGPDGVTPVVCAP